MNVPDLKKLITTFLVLSITASSGVFLFSSFAVTRSSPEDTAEENAPLAQGAAIGSNAFVEPIPESFVPFPIGSERGIVSAPIPSKNLTEKLVGTLADQIAATNPGVVDGSAPFVPPSTEELNRLLDENIGNFSIDDLGFNLRFQDLKIITKYTVEDIASYVSSTIDVLGTTTASDAYKKIAAQEPNLENARASLAIFADASKKLLAIDVPIELAKLHRSLVLFVATQGKLFEIAANYQNDPAKTIVLANQDIGGIVAQSFKNFEEQFKRTKFPESLSRAQEKENVVSFLKNMVGIREARAYYGIPIAMMANLDPGTLAFHGTETAATTGQWAQKLLEWARRIGTEILKNQIIHTLVKQVVDWIKGGGRPQFVTNWSGFLDNTINSVGGAIIESILPEVCGPLGPLARIALKRPPNLQTKVGCSLDRIGVNLNNFYRRFSNGGWVAYTSSFAPSGNFFGTIVQASDFVKKRVGQEADAKEKETDGGFKSLKICSDGSRPEPGVYTICTNADCSASYEAECPDGKPSRVTSPGGVAGGLAKKAIADSPIDKIVNSQDIEALVSALVDSFMNKLIQSGVSGITGAFNDDTTSVGTQSSRTYGPGSCTGLIGAAYTTCLGVGASTGYTIPGQQPVVSVPNFNWKVTATGCPSTATPLCSDVTDPVAQDACIQACFP